MLKGSDVNNLSTGIIMINLLKTTATTLLLLSLTFTAQATIIDNNDFTTDTTQGLDFLDINIFSANTKSFFEAGVTFGGRNWTLASNGQLNQLFSSITGENVISTSTHNFLPGGAKAVLDLVAGSTVDSSDWLHTSNGSMYIHYSCCNDTHVRSTTVIANTGAWLVASSASIPEPTSIAMFGLALSGLMLSRSKKRS